jgi:hypothetical protein
MMPGQRAERRGSAFANQGKTIRTGLTGTRKAAIAVISQPRHKCQTCLMGRDRDGLRQT